MSKYRPRRVVAPVRKQYYIESCEKGTQKWERHIPGYHSRETAEKFLEDLIFYALAREDREYRVTP